MTKKFDSRLKEILNEYSPASLMDTFGGTSEKIAKKIEDLPTKSQHWGPLQKLSPEARMVIIKNIIRYIFEDNDENTYSLAINNEEDLKTAIDLAIRKAANQNPEFKAKGKWAIKFLVDRLSNKELLGNVKYTTDGGKEVLADKDITQAEVKIALKKAIEKADKDVSANINTIKKDNSSASSQEFNPRAEYYLKKYEEIPSGSISDDLRTVYERISNVAGETLTGKEFVAFFQRYGFGIKEVKQLLAANVLELGDAEMIPGDSEGFDVSEDEYIERSTRDARRDYEEAGFKSRYGIDFG